MRLGKKIFIFGLLGLMIIGSGFLIIKKVSKKTCDKCNIMLIDVDILRADELPCYGYPRNTMPNICEFAKKSVSFKDNYSTSYWTLPSIFSVITSLYPTFHQMQVNYMFALSSRIPTLAETLHKQGYKTVYVGQKDDLMSSYNGGFRGYDLVTQEPIEKVIDELSKSSQPWFIHRYISELHMPYLLPDNLKPVEDLPVPKNLPTTYYTFDLFFNKYLKEHYKEIFKQKAIDEYRAIILGPDKADDISVTNLFDKLRADDKTINEYLLDAWRPRLDFYLKSFDGKNPQDVAYLRMMYDTKLKYLDEKLKPLLQRLDSSSLSKNTITVIMSDHGEAFGEHGTFSHEDNHFTELFYTPLIIRAPQFEAKQVEQTTNIVDIFPTILDLTGEKKIDMHQGQSLVPYMNGQTKNDTTFSLSQSIEGTLLQNKNWLYFLPNSAKDMNESELYNKTIDPLEKVNVTGQNQDLVKTLFKKADLFRSYGGIDYEKEEIPLPNRMKLDPDKIERLKKEGYF